MAPKEKLEPTKQPLTAVLLADSFTQVGRAERFPLDQGRPVAAEHALIGCSSGVFGFLQAVWHR